LVGVILTVAISQRIVLRRYSKQEDGDEDLGDMDFGEEQDLVNSDATIEKQKRYCLVKAQRYQMLLKTKYKITLARFFSKRKDEIFLDNSRI
jgi:hypothetical protein